MITDIKSRSLKETKDLAKSIKDGVRVEIVVGDISSKEFAQSLGGIAISTFGRLDYAVNAAGISGVRGATGEIEFEEWKNTQQVNVDGVWSCMHGQLKVMMEQELMEGYR